MKKFKVTVTNTKEVEIEIDETEMTEAWMAEFRRDYSDLHTIEQHAGLIGEIMALELQSSGNFVAGYGYIRTSNQFRGSEYSYEASQNPSYLRRNINVQQIDEYCETDVEEQK